MIVPDDYILAFRVRDVLFSVDNIPIDIRDDLLARAARTIKLRNLANDRGASFEDVKSGAILADAEEIPLTDEIKREARALGKNQLEYSFQRYLATVRLYLAPLEGGAVVKASQALIERTGRYSRNGGEWKFLANRYLNVQVRRRCDASDAARKLLDYRDDFEMSGSVMSCLEKLIRHEPAYRSLQHLEGAFLCILKEDAPDAKKLREVSYLPSEDEADADKVAVGRIGRPEKQTQVLEAYLARFPNGHNGYTQKEVLKILLLEEGVSASTTTLQDVLKRLKTAQIETEKPENSP